MLFRSSYINYVTIFHESTSTAIYRHFCSFFSVLKIEGDVGLSVSIIVLPFFGIVTTTIIFLLFSRVRDSGTLSIVVCS